MASEQKDNRLPIDPAKLTVGEAYEYRPSVGEAWTVCTASSRLVVENVGSRLREGSPHFRAAQPPIESLRPGDVVEVQHVSWHADDVGNLRCNVVAGEFGPRIVASYGGAMDVGCLNNGNWYWRLVYRAENVPQQQKAPHNLGECIGKRECDECGSPRPFSWSDLKPGDEFEFQSCSGEWRRSVVLPDGKLKTTDDGVPLTATFAHDTSVRGRWPVNKPTQNSSGEASQDSLTAAPHAGSAVSSKPASIGKIEHMEWDEFAKGRNEVTERIIPWDGQDFGQLRKGRFLLDRKTGAWREILCTPTPEFPIFSVRNLRGGDYHTFNVESGQRSQLQGHDIIEPITPPTKPACTCFSKWEHDNVPGCRGERP